MIKLVLSDMDNTLVPFGQHCADERTLKAIHEVMRAGVHFGPATGRDYIELGRLFAEDGSCFETGVLSNGKRIMLDGECIEMNLFDHELIRRIHKVLEPHEGMFLALTPAHTNKDNPVYGWGTYQEELDHYGNMIHFTGHVVDDVPDIDLIAVAIGCSGDDERLKFCQRIVMEAVPEVVAVSPLKNWLDVLPVGVSKRQGKETLIKAMGIQEDEVVVFGDAENDLEILSHSTYSVAVANASNAVKACARYQVGACAEGGMVDALLEIARATRAGEMPEFLRTPVQK